VHPSAHTSTFTLNLVNPRSNSSRDLRCQLFRRYWKLGPVCFCAAADISSSTLPFQFNRPASFSMTSVLQYRDPIAYQSNDFMSTANYTPSHMASLKKTPPYDDHSSGSECKRQQTPGAKRRPSRAGTRSVTTLTAAQLERKRANDREAQRAIRQRTKDHIENLERQIRDLTTQRDTNSSTKLIELMRRNEELEQENAVLRTRLSHAVAALGVSDQSGGMSDDARLHPKQHSNVPVLSYSGFFSLLFDPSGRTRFGSYGS
jgi:regulator of replication initiation timing